MKIAEMREFLQELPPEAEMAEVKVIRNYPDDASVKEIQKAVYMNDNIYLYLK